MRAYILGREVHGEKFWRVAVLTAEEGVSQCLVRQSAKKATIVPDLFDEADLRFDKAKAGTNAPRFVREYTLCARHTGISGDYSALVYASRFAAVLSRNAFPPDARDAIFSLCGNVIDAFSGKPRRDATYFKALWLLARESGLPVREDWFYSLPFADKETVSKTLRTPLDSLEVPTRDIELMISRIEYWLAVENDFSFGR